MQDVILSLQDQFDQTEIRADANVLQELMAEDFLSIGPRGFVVTKQEWIDRHQLYRYLHLDITDRTVHLYEKAAIVCDIQRNQSLYQGETREFNNRVMQVWVEIDGQWRLAGIQSSPLAQGS